MTFKRDALSEVLDRRVFGPGSVIFREGETAGTAYIVLKGSVEVTVGTGDETKTLTTVIPGQLFGELALLTGRDRTATATTRGGCEVLVVPSTHVTKKLVKADPFLRYWVEYLAERVVDLTARVK